jgi:hypothetical protein
MPGRSPSGSAVTRNLPSVASLRESPCQELTESFHGASSRHGVVQELPISSNEQRPLLLDPGSGPGQRRKGAETP